MPKKIAQCPDCDMEMKPDAARCPNCGLNIHTGESYEMRLKKVKGEDRRKPSGQKNLGFIIIIALGFVVLGGFLYQRNMVSIIQENQDIYGNYIEQFDDIDRHIEEGQKGSANEAAQALVAELNERLGSLAEEDKNERRLINNLISKAEHRLESIEG